MEVRLKIQMFSLTQDLHRAHCRLTCAISGHLPRLGNFQTARWEVEAGRRALRSFLKFHNYQSCTITLNLKFEILPAERGSWRILSDNSARSRGYAESSLI